MKVLLLEPGGRERALAHATATSKQLSELVIASGNPGTAALGRNMALNPDDPEAVLALSQETAANLAVIGPEAPLVARVVGTLRTAGSAAFGPSRAAAQLEGSKAFVKEIMMAAGVPTVAGVACSTLAEARATLQRFRASYMMKQNGLTADKGVVVTEGFAAALQHVVACTGAASLSASRESGVTPTPGVMPHETRLTASTAPAASPAVVVEEYLDGPEVSVFCLCDGENVVALPPTQDYKRTRDGGGGPSTDRMGAYSLLPWASPDLGQRTAEGVARPVLAEMVRRGTSFVGLLYVGLVLTSRGLRVVEFSARFGDPEAQSVLERVESDLLAYLWTAATGSLGAMPELQIGIETVVSVMLATLSYPGAPQAGGVITGLDARCGMSGVHVIHAGIRLTPREPGASGASGVNGAGGANEASGVVASAADQAEPSRTSGISRTVARKPATMVPGADRRSLTSGDALASSGGRMLSAVARGSDLETARERAYALMVKTYLEGGHSYHDIAALQGRRCISVFRTS